MDPQELHVQELPKEIAYVWKIFCQLDRERPHDPMSGKPMPLTSEKLQAWASLRRTSFSPVELEAIDRLDRLVVSQKFNKPEE